MEDPIATLANELDILRLRQGADMGDDDDDLDYLDDDEEEEEDDDDDGNDDGGGADGQAGGGGDSCFFCKHATRSGHVPPAVISRASTATKPRSRTCQPAGVLGARPRLTMQMI